MPKGQVIAGIDVGTDKICTIIASKSLEQDKLNVIGVASQPSQGLRKSQIVDIEEAIKSITESVEAAERMAGYSLSHAYVSISGAHISSQNSKGVVAVSEPEGEIVAYDVDRVIEAARAISLPASREILHCKPKNFIVDSQEGIKDPIGMTGVRLEAETHIITSLTTATRNMTKCVLELGINIDSLVFAGLASAIATVSETEKELGVVLIDIGAGSTSVCIFSEGSLTHSVVLPIGARNITNDLAIGMRISLQSAEIIKKHLSTLEDKPILPKSTDTKEDLRRRQKQADEINLTTLNLKEDTRTVSKKTLSEGIIRPRLNEIFQMVGQELKNSGFWGATPAGVVLTGGGSLTYGILESAKRTLSLPARQGTPKGLSGLTDELGSPEYATAVGLILYGNQATPTSTKSSLSDFSFPLSGTGLKSTATKLRNFFKSFLP